MISLIFIKRGKLCRKNLKNLTRLARSLPCDACANILKSIKKKIFSTGFLENHRQSETDFTRNRKFPFHLLICFLINFVKSSYQGELDRFFQAITRSPIANRVVSFQFAFKRHRHRQERETPEHRAIGKTPRKNRSTGRNRFADAPAEELRGYINHLTWTRAD